MATIAIVSCDDRGAMQDIGIRPTHNRPHVTAPTRALESFGSSRLQTNQSASAGTAYPLNDCKWIEMPSLIVEPIKGSVQTLNREYIGMVTVPRIRLFEFRFQRL